LFKDKLTRHSIAFGLIVVASILLYLAAQAGSSVVIWVLLAFILAGDLLVLAFP